MDGRDMNGPYTKFMSCFLICFFLLPLPDTSIVEAHKHTPWAYFNSGDELQREPEFVDDIKNITVAQGRDATFTCIVNHLGEFKVAWVKADTKAIQAIHSQVITHNERIKVSHKQHNIWNLHILSVEKADSGPYMCQVNTVPMKSRSGNLEVVVPPDFILSDISGDTMVAEGNSAKLSCRANGYPAPTIRWQREDGRPLVIRNHLGDREKVNTYEGSILPLTKITRSDIGPYLCIASNGVPPSISKRVFVEVHFHPTVNAPVRSVSAPFGGSVRIECLVEACPRTVNFWMKDHSMLTSGEKYKIEESMQHYYLLQMVLVIKRFTPKDVGTYMCHVKSSLGLANESIELYGSFDLGSSYDFNEYIEIYSDDAKKGTNNSDDSLTVIDTIMNESFSSTAPALLPFLCLIFPSVLLLV